MKGKTIEVKAKGRKLQDISKTHFWATRAVFRKNDSRKTSNNWSDICWKWILTYPGLFL